MPVFLEEGDDPDHIISESNFKPIWDVLKALRAHDDALADRLDQYRTNMGLGVARKTDKLDKIIFDLPINIGSEFSNALTTQIVEATSDTEHWLGLLYFIKKEKVLQRLIIDIRQRMGRIGCMGEGKGPSTVNDKERIEKLEDEGWSWDPLKRLELCFRSSQICSRQ